ncbi:MULTISPECIES: hypothetical protein [Lactobacillaceae]|uniref:Uncharacterized protein n=1 Tax=Loigolactobacillus zhaoyuanensis TaxID=2486017 RepID=A0ABW8UGY4_9LACO|nr:hypothetical protein [Lactiplantibacillus plantarum]MEA5157582.1 hypothetical protein [Lactiplantibacillus plantarum]
MRLGPHVIFGFTVSEWVGIVGILSGTYGFIVKPLLTKLETLSKSIDQISENSLIEHNRLWQHYDIHDKQIWKHDQEIDVLYTKNHLKRSNIKFDDKRDN